MIGQTIKVCHVKLKDMFAKFKVRLFSKNIDKRIKIDSRSLFFMPLFLVFGSKVDSVHIICLFFTGNYI